MIQKQVNWLSGLLIVGMFTVGCSSPLVGAATPPPVTTAQTTAGQPDAATVITESASPTSDITTLPRNSDGFVDISVEQLAEMLQQKNFTLVNVHIPYEGELPNTDLMIPFDQIKEHQAELPAKDAPIVLYCRSGSMSTQAAKDLVALGYTNIFELDGGFNSWQAAGYPLLRE